MQKRMHSRKMRNGTLRKRHETRIEKKRTNKPTLNKHISENSTPSTKEGAIIPQQHDLADKENIRQMHQKYRRDESLIKEKMKKNPPQLKTLN